MPGRYSHPMILELGRHAATGVDPGVTVVLTVLGIVVTAAVALVVALVQLNNQQRRWLLDLKWSTYTRTLQGFDRAADMFEKGNASPKKKAALIEHLVGSTSELLLLLPRGMKDALSNILDSISAKPFSRADYNTAYGFLVDAMRKDMGVKSAD